MLNRFDLIKEAEVPELRSTLRFFRHKKTGAELLSVINDDKNKVFGITFKTPPSDSTGVAHILEHSVLCGSRKYPLKEPFVELLKGSLQTFLNAFTYPDRTCYPVASQNLKDFYNLVDVYLDAVFYPRLTPQVFQQEAWHYEVDDRLSQLSFKGVVFNEMKGAFSAPESLLMRYIQQSLFPDTSYGFESGGDPEVIPELTYHRLMAFHKNNYHPSNARIYFYGDDPPDERLALIEQYLKDFDANPLTPDIGTPAPFQSPVTKTCVYPASEKDAKAMLTVNWLLSPVLEIESNLVLNVLAYLLIGTPASPLRKALIDSGLGEAVTGAGFEGELLHTYFSTGMKGVAPENLPKVERVIQDTLERLSREGYPPEGVEAALNTLEFGLREQNTGQMPKGLILMLRALSVWLYGGDPFKVLAFEPLLKKLKTDIAANKRLFEEATEQFLLNNPHRTTVLLKPDPTLADRKALAEKERLAKARQSMSAEQLRAVKEAAELLQKRQQTPDPPEALARIPTLKLSEIEKYNITIPCDVLERQDTTVLFHDLFTSGIVYVDAGLNIRLLPQQYLPFVAIFSRALLETGTAQWDFISLIQRIGQKTGGIRTALFSSALKQSPDAAAWLFIRGKAMAAQMPEMLDIISDIITTARFDNRERIKQIILEEKASFEQGLVPRGHQVVSGRLRAHFSRSDWADEQIAGINYLMFLRNLEKNFDQQWDAVSQTLEEMRRLLVKRKSMVFNITTDDKTWQACEEDLTGFIRGFDNTRGEQAVWTPDPMHPGEAMTVPSMVNYVGKAANIYDCGYSYHGSIHVLTNLLRNAWLWENIRVQGGAYGSFCSFERLSGTLLFVSYRDPNILKTLEVFDRSSAFLKNSVTTDDLRKNIIGTIGGIDAYMFPDAKGFVSLKRFLISVTEAELQKMRQEVLDTTLDDVRAFSEVIRDFATTGIAKVLGSEAAVLEANSRKNIFSQVIKLL